MNQRLESKLSLQKEYDIGKGRFYRDFRIESIDEFEQGLHMSYEDTKAIVDLRLKDLKELSVKLSCEKNYESFTCEVDMLMTRFSSLYEVYQESKK